MGIARSVYYQNSVREQKQLERDLELKKMIEDIHLMFPGYGYRRIRRQLLKQGIKVNSKRIQRVMKIYSIFSSRKKHCGPKGKRSLHQLYYPNLIRGFKLTSPNQVWATDITFIKLLRGYVYLSAVIDVYTRKIRLVCIEEFKSRVLFKIFRDSYEKAKTKTRGNSSF
jgi:putative transposase